MAADIRKWLYAVRGAVVRFDAGGRAAGLGFEPRLPGPEPGGLPLPHPAPAAEYSRRFRLISVRLARKNWCVREQVRAHLEAGMTVSETARELGITQATVCYH